MSNSDHSSLENLKDLDKRLNRAQRKSCASEDHSTSIEKKRTPIYSLALRVGTEMVSALIVGVGIGYFLDYWLDTRPWFLVLFFFLGAGAGILNVYRAASNFETTQGLAETTTDVSTLIKQKKLVINEKKSK